jgi:hypothetical protein
MAFTYVAPTSDRDKVRFLIGDTISADAHFQDEEITYLLEVQGNVYDAAIQGAELLAGRYAHRSNYSRSVGDLSISEQYGTSATEFRELARTLTAQRDSLFPPSIKINAQAIVATGKKVVEEYKSDFYTGIHDYTV